MSESSTFARSSSNVPYSVSRLWVVEPMRIESCVRSSNASRAGISSASGAGMPARASLEVVPALTDGVGRGKKLNVRSPTNSSVSLSTPPATALFLASDDDSRPLSSWRT